MIRMTTGLLALVVMGFTFFFPESPRWLVLKSRVDDARHNISVFDDMPIDSEPVEAALAGIVTMHEQAMETASVWQLFKMGPEKMRYRLILASVTQLWSQMGGSGLITYYAEQLFSNIGLDHDTARLLAATDLTWKAVCSFIPFFVLERFGRRKLLMFSGGGMTACLVSIGSCHCHEEGIIRKTRLAKRATVEHDADCTSSLLPSAVRRPRTTTRSLPVSAFSLSTPSSFSTPMASSVATGLS